MHLVGILGDVVLIVGALAALVLGSWTASRISRWLGSLSHKNK
jgi:hypothetical protein